MIILISPAKTLDFDSTLDPVASTQPDFISDSALIVKKMKTLSSKKLEKLMRINKELAGTNAMRYQQWSTSFNTDNSRPAMLAFNGEVYRGLNAKTMDSESLDFAQQHLRILSGLHGVLRPLDLIQPYRLEMGTSIAVGRRKNLYHFWQDRVTQAIQEAMDRTGSNELINLASAEYSKVVDFSRIQGKVITPVFKDFKAGEYRIVMTWAKHARGAMASFAIRNRLKTAEELKGFPDYSFNDRLTTSDEWVFTREVSA